MTDNELVEQVRNGKRQAFTELMRRHQQKIYWVARRIVGSHADADDIVQETFLKAYLSLGDFRGDASFSTWIYRIAVNMSLNTLRKNHLLTYVRESELAHKVFRSKESADDHVRAEQLETLIEHAVAQLPDKQRAVFVMRFYDELSYEEIASVLKTSIGGLKANYHHALKKVQEALRHEKDMGKSPTS